MPYVRKPRAGKTAGQGGIAESGEERRGEEESAARVVVKARPRRAAEDAAGAAEYNAPAPEDAVKNVPFMPRLPSMPDIYGKPEPRNDDGGKPRLSINELIRLNMVDLRG
ncbi:MAG: hypothetical protein LBD31_07055, partial [Treponema sp.]|nr:hypothetical protein [Treponema sp.]